MVAQSKDQAPDITFVTEDNETIPAFTELQAKALYDLMKQRGPNIYQLLENAGRNVAEVALKFLNDTRRDPSHSVFQIVVLVGAGRKGAVGLVAARHLSNRKGLNVIICKARSYHLSEDFMYQETLYKMTKGKEAHVGSLPVGSADLIVDALIGGGLRLTSFDETTRELIVWANSNGSPILAIDIPTGVNSTTGNSLREYIHANCTVCLGLVKSGSVKEKTGQLYLVDIGIPSSLLEQIMGTDRNFMESPFPTTSPSSILKLLQIRRRKS